jgi:restriction endonuclease Mrr
LAKWKEFESLIAALQKQTAGDATVLHNQRVKGRSGGMRQIDIMISQQVGLYPVSIAIECKRHRRPLGIDKVEAFVTKLRDVSASHGVMVSNTGFDAGAKAIAKGNLVTLLSYRNCEIGFPHFGK